MTKISFPQADSLNRVLQIAGISGGANISLADISATQGITNRQARYYADAAVYLGLLTRDGSGLTATKEGRRLARIKTASIRHTAIAAILSTRPVFGRAITAAKNGRAASRSSLTNWVQRHSGLNPTTSRRRASTVDSWTRAITA